RDFGQAALLAPPSLQYRTIKSQTDRWLGGGNDGNAWPSPWLNTQPEHGQQGRTPNLRRKAPTASCCGEIEHYIGGIRKQQVYAMRQEHGLLLFNDDGKVIKKQRNDANLCDIVALLLGRRMRCDSAAFTGVSPPRPGCAAPQS